MWRAAVAIAFLAACSGNPCSDGDVCQVTAPSLNGYYDVRLVGDGDEFVVVFGASYTASYPDDAGLWAAHPGGGVRHVVPDVSAQYVAATATEEGVLACWWSGACGSQVPPDYGCVLLDADLEARAAPTQEAYGWVAEFPRVAGQLYALSVPACDVGGLQLTPIADDGTPMGATVPLPCTQAPSSIAWAGDQIACLLPSDPLCGDQFDEPPDCRTMLQRFDGTGTALGDPVDVAPFGYYSGLADVHLAAREDGFLVDWFYGDGMLRAQAVGSDGTLGAVAELASGTGLTGGITGLGPTPDGYVAFWIPGDLPHPLEYVTFAADGTRLSDSALLGVDADLSAGCPDTVSVAVTGGRAAAAWLADNRLEGNDNRVGILFQQLGRLAASRSSSPL